MMTYEIQAIKIDRKDNVTRIKYKCNAVSDKQAYFFFHKEHGYKGIRDCRIVSKGLYIPEGQLSFL